MTTVLPQVHGRINDLDSHLQVPVSRWGEVFGEATARFGRQFAGIDLFDATDEPELTTDSVWTTKGTAAPGASTPEGRLAAMDVMGIERQLIFPQVVLALPAWSDHPNAGRVLREYNDAVLRWTAAGGGRLRPTALLNLTTIDGAIAEAERVQLDLRPQTGEQVQAFVQRVYSAPREIADRARKAVQPRSTVARCGWVALMKYSWVRRSAAACSNTQRLACPSRPARPASW
jgi:hypothetical protein